MDLVQLTSDARIDLALCSPASATPVPRKYNRKSTTPSEAMTASDGHHYRCTWIENSITVHCDGNVSCGLDDPHGQRSFGNINKTAIEQIFRNPEYRNLQTKLWNGHRCHDCDHFRQVEENCDPSPQGRRQLPTVLVLETTFTCNIRCPNDACRPNNDPLETTRDSSFLTFDAVKTIADQLSSHLETIHFYNYGEPFMHRQAEEMLLYLRQRCPGAMIITSTNGIPLASPSRARTVALAAPDRVVFTISGVTQEAYARYHVKGRLDLALKGMKNVCDAARLNQQTRTSVVWRYLVFNWNDSDEEIDAAIALAKEYGLNQLNLLVTNNPADARSTRFSPGSPSFFKYRDYIFLQRVGSLYHLYHCELPDKDGLFQLENVPGLGWARRTGSQAILRPNGPNGQLRLSISTDRLMSRGCNHSCVIHAPWRTYRIPLTYGMWRDVSIRVPLALRDNPEIEYKVATDDYWFPSEEGDGSDFRCLGVIIKAKVGVTTGATRRYLVHRRIVASVGRACHRLIRSTVFGRTVSRVGSELANLSSRLWITMKSRRRLPEVVAVNEPANSSMAQDYLQSMKRLYRACLNREPDQEGLDCFLEGLRSGRLSLIEAVQFFVTSPEFHTLYGANPTPDVFVNALYENSVGRAPDAADYRRWVDYLAQNGNTRAAKAAVAIGISGLMSSAAPRRG
jgi:MoaA/NifB/PqqE/SkfB family radical SAM enzyme